MTGYCVSDIAAITGGVLSGDGAALVTGVVIDSRTVQIDPEVVIAPGAVILAGTILRGKTVIGAGCVIGPNTLIEDSTVDEGTTVNASQVYGSHLGPHNNLSLIHI